MGEGARAQRGRVRDLSRADNALARLEFASLILRHPPPQGERVRPSTPKMKKSPFDLTGKVAVITGSSRGIGRATAELLAQLGAKVVVSSRKADACEEVAKAIRADGGEAHVIPCNISRRNEVDAL